MCRFWWLLFLVCVVSCQVAQNQRRRHIMNYSSHSPVAQDRRFHWMKYLKKRERQKLRYFKKYFKKCGFSPFKFGVFRRSDDDDYTIHSMIPYGYKDEYFPKPEIDEDEVVPVEYRIGLSTTKPLYSAKYRAEGTENSLYDYYWRPAGREGTTDGTVSNSNRYDLSMS